MKNLFAIGSGLVVAGLFLFISILYHSVIIGYTLNVMWEWFIAPTFNIRSIGLIEAIGISLLFIFLKIDYKESAADKRAVKKNKEEEIENFFDKFLEEKYIEEKDIWQEVALFFLTPLVFSALTLLIGYIVHMFMGQYIQKFKRPLQWVF